ncbi:hypothetical protein J0S82_018331 [Galemys pyrenaicus]|uniref:Uncharacterized protein n=1 Tax=Galemys pyrenaicus TaxID=202257 RepID=A0A8J6DES6_GALPY|nr:hypothetical protein J0S82_018331 [Galemys pyrenaicus]
MLPPWRPAGPPDTPSPLLLREACSEDLCAPRGLDARPPPAAGRPGRGGHRARSPDTSPGRESPHQRPGSGPGRAWDSWAEGEGPAGPGRMWDGAEGDLSGQCWLTWDSWGRLTWEAGAGTPGGVQSERGVSERQAPAPHPGPGGEPPLLLLQGEVSVLGGALGRGASGQGQVWGPGRGLSEQEDEASAATYPGAQGAGGPSLLGGRLPAGQGRALGGPLGREDRCVRSGHFLLVQDAGPAGQGLEGEVARALQQLVQGRCGRGGHSPEGPWGAEDAEDETLSSTEEGGEPLPPSPALTPEPAEPGATCRGQARPGRRADDSEQELEACVRHLCQLAGGGPGRRGSALAGEDWTSAPRWRGCREGACAPWALLDQGVAIRCAGEASPTGWREDGERGDAQVPGCGGLPGTEPGPDGGSWGPRDGPSQPPPVLERVRRRIHQLIAGLKRERRRVLRDNARLQGEQERCRRETRSLQRERERNAQEIAALRREKGLLGGEAAHLRRELAQHLQVIADLEDCNRQSHSRIAELEEENERLRGHGGQPGGAVASGAVERAARDRRELQALVSGLGVRCKELLEDVELGVEGLARAFRGQKEQLLCRLSVLERGVVWGASAGADGGPLGGTGALLQGTQAPGPASAVEKGVQVSQSSRQLIPGGTLEEDVSVAVGCRGAPPRVEHSRRGADAGSAAPALPGACAGASAARRGDVGGAGVGDAPSEEEAGRPRGPAEPGRTLSAPDAQVGHTASPSLCRGP